MVVRSSVEGVLAELAEPRRAAHAAAAAARTSAYSFETAEGKRLQQQFFFFFRVERVDVHLNNLLFSTWKTDL